MNYESESFRNGTKVEGRHPNYFKVGHNNFEFVLRARSKITWHFCIPTSPYLSSIFIRKNPRNSPLFLRFCSIRLMKSTAKSPGLVGDEIRLAVTYNGLHPESTFNMEIFRWGTNSTGGLVKQDVEKWQNLSMDPNNARYVEDFINR